VVLCFNRVTEFLHTVCTYFYLYLIFILYLLCLQFLIILSSIWSNVLESFSTEFFISLSL
jgi:hypothetical protein